MLWLRVMVVVGRRSNVVKTGVFFPSNFVLFYVPAGREVAIIVLRVSVE